MADTLQDRLTLETVATIQRFNQAFNRHDAEAVMAAMTDDCLFENTFPPPDGEHFQGQVAIRGFWERMFRSSPDAYFETEELFAVGDRCVIRWRYSFTGEDGISRHIRGVDVCRVRDGKVAEKLSYVKG